MNEKEQIDKDILLKCAAIVAGSKGISFGDAYFYSVVLNLYRFVQSQKIYVNVQLKLPDGRSAYTNSDYMTVDQIVEDYVRLKSKELSDEAEKAQYSANNGNPLKGGVKSRLPFISRLFSCLGFKKSST